MGTSRHRGLAPLLEFSVGNVLKQFFPRRPIAATKTAWIRGNAPDFGAVDRVVLPR
jgi:hypothetical protein